jgi:hypothetical protein
MKPILITSICVFFCITMHAQFTKSGQERQVENLIKDKLANRSSTKTDSNLVKSNDSTKQEGYIRQLIEDNYLKGEDEEIGVMYLSHLKAYCYATANKEKKDLTINRISVEIDEGTISDLDIYTSLGKFSNKHAISIPRIRKAWNDQLFLEDSSDKYYVVLGEMLHYENTGSSYKIPRNQIFTLDNTNPVQKMFINGSLSGIVDVKIFSDMLSLFENKPNGLLQTELSSKTIFNTRHFSNCGFYLFTYVKPFVHLSKFDKQFQAVKADTVDTTKINRTELIQRSSVRFGAELNVIQYEYKHRLVALLNGGWYSNMVKVQEKNETEPTNFYQNTFFVSASASLQKVWPISVEFKLTLLYQDLIAYGTFKNTEYRLFYNPQLTITYSKTPVSRDKLFLRYNNVWEDSDLPHAFNQFQFGYTANLNDLFNKDKKEKQEQ